MRKSRRQNPSDEEQSRQIYTKFPEDLYHGNQDNPYRIPHPQLKHKSATSARNGIALFVLLAENSEEERFLADFAHILDTGENPNEQQCLKFHFKHGSHRPAAHATGHFFP